MDIVRIITPTVFGIVAISISLIVAKLFLDKFKRKSEIDGNINVAFSILFLGWLTSLFLSNFKSIVLMSEYVEMVSRIGNSDSISISDISQVSFLFIGLTNLYLVICYFISKSFLNLFTGKRIDANEIEINHYSFFVMKSSIFIGFVVCLLPVFEIILRVFIPSVDVPFYR